MSLPWFLFTVWVAIVVLQYMYASYKYGCLEKSDYYRAHRWARNGFGGYLTSPAVLVWPIVVFGILLWLPFGGLRRLGRKFGCEAKF